MFRPILPPKAGYVEVLDDEGNHIYSPTEETKIKEEQEALIKSLAQQITDLQLALCEIYETAEGGTADG